MAYFAGLDLGQAQDYTALAIAQRHEDPAGDRFDLSWLERFPLRTSYPAIAAAIVDRMARLAASARDASRFLVVDSTGVGRPVVDLLRRAQPSCMLVDVTITGGDTATQEAGSWRVPKRDLISSTQVLIQSGRLKIAQALPEAATLTQELLTFKVKIDPVTAHDSYGAWREGQHDDLVLATALACWAGGRLGKVNARYMALDDREGGSWQRRGW
mgnify:CR=1 FL=1